MGTYNPDARKQYKQRARADISTRFWPTMLCVILYIIPIALVAVIYELAMLGAENDVAFGRVGLIFVVYILALLLITAPLYLGLKRYMLELAHGGTPSATTVLSCFMNGHDFVNSIKLMLSIFVRSLGWMLLLCLVSGIAGGVFAVVGLSGMSNVLKALIIIVLVAVIVVVSCVFSVLVRRYDGAYIIVLTNPEQGAWDATGACVPVFQGHLWELFVFDLSFILWILATAITFGIVGIYVTAYTEIAFIHYFEALWLGKPAEKVSYSDRVSYTADTDNNDLDDDDDFDYFGDSDDSDDDSDDD